MRRLLIGVRRADGHKGETYALITVAGELVRQPFFSDDGKGWCCTSLWIKPDKTTDIVVVPEGAATRMFVQLGPEETT